MFWFIRHAAEDLKISFEIGPRSTSESAEGTPTSQFRTTCIYIPIDLLSRREVLWRSLLNELRSVHKQLSGENPGHDHFKSLSPRNLDFTLEIMLDFMIKDQIREHLFNLTTLGQQFSIFVSLLPLNYSLLARKCKERPLTRKGTSVKESFLEKVRFFHVHWESKKTGVFHVRNPTWPWVDLGNKVQGHAQGPS